MPEFRMTKGEEEQLKEQFSRWKNILNWKIAPIAFTAFFAAFPIKEYRSIISWVGVLLLAAAYAVARHEFPRMFEQLRTKKERSFREEVIIRGIASYYFGWPNLISHFALWLLAAFLLGLVLVGIPGQFGL